MRNAAAEVVIEPGFRGWLVSVHWPRGHPTKLSFTTEQAARNWIETASADWIANHPRHRVATARSAPFPPPLSLASLSSVRIRPPSEVRARPRRREGNLELAYAAASSGRIRMATFAIVARLHLSVSCICDHDRPALSMRAIRAFFAVFSRGVRCNGLGLWPSPALAQLVCADPRNLSARQRRECRALGH